MKKRDPFGFSLFSADLLPIRLPVIYDNAGKKKNNRQTKHYRCHNSSFWIVKIQVPTI